MARIVHVIDSLEPGGAERVAVNLANGLHEKGFDTIFCVTGRSGQLRDSIHGDIEVTNLEKSGRFDLSAFVKFRRLVRGNRPTIVHAHGNSSAMFAIVATRGLSNVRVVHHDHNSLLDDRNVLLEKLILTRADIWIVVSEQIGAWVHRNVGIPVPRVLVNPVETRSHTVVRRTVSGPLSLCMLAGYRSVKNYDGLIDAAEALGSFLSPKNLRIDCYGAHYGSRYHRQIESRLSQSVARDIVHVHPPVEDVAPVLSAAHVGLLLSRSEGLSVALLEYMASGLPVIVTDVGECGNVVRSSGCGIVVSPGDREATARAIQTVAYDYPVYAERGLKGRVYVEQRHSVESCVGILLSEVYSI